MNIMRALKLNTGRFHREENGSIPVEGVLAFTFLAWWYIASFQYFDAFRQKNINLKAAYTVADLLSRETGPIPTDPTSVPVNQPYIDGMNTVFDYLTNSNKATWIRVSSVYWDDTAQKYRVDWSTPSGSGHEALTTTKLQAFKDRIPVLPTGDTVIVVETFMAFEPIFSIGLDARWFETFITTAPRFASCLPWESNGCGTDNNGNWINPDLDPEEIDPGA